MDKKFPVYTTDNECQDCYKCVRHCDCKAIRIINSRAAVIPELCVSCGECVKVCPAHAKKIRSDLDRARFLLANGEKLYASIAPSWPGYFKGITLNALAGALKKLGFIGCGETALGAQLVSAETGKFLKNAPPGVYLSSACPAAVDYVRKYHPDWTDSIVPVVSPVIAHTRLVHKELGSDVRVIFFGPCAAKKNESDRMPQDLALAITFPVLESWLEAERIDLAAQTEVELSPRPAEEGRVYSLEGGMNDTLRDPAANVRYLAVSGIANIGNLLAKMNPEEIRKSGGRLFVEMLACAGGCVNGPAMGGVASALDVVMKTYAQGANQTSLGREVPVNMSLNYLPEHRAVHKITEEEITEALASVGKFTLADELNCGGCGYNSCREFAAAQIEGKAEPAMCVSYLRKISRKTSTALIKYIPAGVVFADRNLQIIECNRHFAELWGQDTLLAYDACGSLSGADLHTMIPFCDLLESVLAAGGELERFNQLCGDRIYNISVFSISPGKTAGAVVQDVTRNEIQREQVAEKAREVIRKNVLAVQKIARELGEHMADTEILLNEVAGAYEHPESAAPPAAPAPGGFDK